MRNRLVAGFVLFCFAICFGETADSKPIASVRFVGSRSITIWTSTQPDSDTLSLLRSRQNRIVIVSPGFQKTVCVLGTNAAMLGQSDGIEAEIVEGTTNGIEIGEKVYITINRIESNRTLYESIRKTTLSRTISRQECDRIFLQSETALRMNANAWNCISNLTAIRLSDTAAQDLKIRATYLTAMLFYSREYSHIALNTEKASLDDQAMYREMLWELVTGFNTSSDLIMRAYYNLAYYYVNVWWETKNAVFYKYMKLARKYGELFFDYGMNILSTMEPDSILFTEGGDNEVFALQSLLQMEHLRPDVTVYDRMGNLFDQVYGDLHRITAELYVRNLNASLKYIIRERRPPESTIIHSFVDPERAFRKRTGKIYFTWQCAELSNANQHFAREGLTTYHLEKKGILYELIPDGSHLHSLSDNLEIYKNYVWHGDTNEWLSYPSLMREIVANYYYAIGEDYRSRIDSGKPQTSEARTLWESAKRYYALSVRYGYDSPAYSFNTAVFYLNNPFEDLSGEAIYLLERTMTVDKGLPAAFLLYCRTLAIECFKNPQKEKETLKKINRWMNLYKNLIAEDKYTDGDYSKSQSWQHFRQIDSMIGLLNERSAGELAAMEQELSNAIVRSVNPVDIENAKDTILMLFSRGMGWDYRPYTDRAYYYFSELNRILSEDLEYMQWALSISIQLKNSQLVYRIGKILTELDDKENIELYYLLGLTCNELRKRDEAEAYLRKFLEMAENSEQYRLENPNKIADIKELLSTY